MLTGDFVFDRDFPPKTMSQVQFVSVWHYRAKAGKKTCVDLVTPTLSREVNTVRILVAEDEKKIASHIKGALEGAGHSVAVVHDGETALSKILNREFDVI